jgi:O-succinylbenzoic acid--CoA ligase
MFTKIHYQTTDLNYINEVNQFINDWFNEDEFIFSLTSGSTGKPKKVKLPKKYLRKSARMTGDFFGFTENDTLLLSLPIFGIGGKMIIIRAIEFNCKLIVVSPQSNPLLELKKQPIKIISLVPYQISKILETNPEVLNNIDFILIGGAPINSIIKNKIKSIKCRVFETFGMTETYSHIGLKEINKEDCFTVFKDINISENDGCLAIKAPSLGIINLITNDIVKVIDNKCFEWLGRKDFVINSGGIKLHPELIEKKIENIINTPFFITKENDLKLGEIVVLIIETKTIDTNSLKKLLKEVLDQFEIPKKIYTISKFVYTQTQKINKIDTLKKIQIDQ